MAFFIESPVGSGHFVLNPDHVNDLTSDASSELNNLLANMPGSDLVTDPIRDAALRQALIPDTAGVWPGKPDYVPTYDVYFAAANIVGFLQAQPVIRSSSSEGTSVAVDAPNWTGLLAWLRTMSPIMQASGQQVLRPISIPFQPISQPVNMQDGGYRYGDVDTDLG